MTRGPSAMDIRNGKCFDCGAEYQIPASFTHDVA
ncbi:MAG: hypothetical protein ACI82F_000721, partial [Planctomycetota bacterium]